MRRTRKLVFSWQQSYWELQTTVAIQQGRPHSRLDLSAPAFAELVWFAPGVSLESLQRYRGKTKRRALLNC